MPAVWARECLSKCSPIFRCIAGYRIQETRLWACRPPLRASDRRSFFPECIGSSRRLSQTFQERRDQFHTLRLGESLDPFNPAVRSFLEQARGVFLQQTGDPVAAQQLAWQALENLRQQQASALAYFDVFLILAVVTVVLVPVVLLMKRSVAAKGAHIGHE